MTDDDSRSVSSNQVPAGAIRVVPERAQHRHSCELQRWSTVAVLYEVSAAISGLEFDVETTDERPARQYPNCAEFAPGSQIEQPVDYCHHDLVASPVIVTAGYRKSGEVPQFNHFSLGFRPDHDETALVSDEQAKAWCDSIWIPKRAILRDRAVRE